MAAPPLSQHHSGMATVFTSVRDIEAHRLLCDDIIIKLNQALGISPATPTQKDRDGLWAMVFVKGWDTNYPVSDPG